jgi:acetolactate synthase I/II/III large subunit
VITPGGAAGMGWGPPAAVAAKLLQPERPVLSVSGDGGFAMVTHVLSTAVQYGVPVVFLIMNNSVLGMVHNFQSMTKRIVATEFVPTDFAAIGKAFGCYGVKVRKPEQLGREIKKAFKADLPTVIDVATDPAEPFLKIAMIEDFFRI